MRKPKCWCTKEPVISCADCGTAGFVAKGQDLEDVRNALSHFIRTREKDSPQTVRAMKRILKNTWKVVKYDREHERAREEDGKRPRVPLPARPKKRGRVAEVH